MAYGNEMNLTPSQVHFLRLLLDGKREMTEQEALARAEKLMINDLVFPCAVVCVSPYYTSVPYEARDDLMMECSEYICHFLRREGYKYFCLTNSYDSFQILFPTTANERTVQDLDELFIRLHQGICRQFGLELFIGIGSAVEGYTDLSRSASEAMEMLAYKHQYSDRGVINIINTSQFKHYSLYGEDIMFARVIGCFQDGNLVMMAVRLNELTEAVRRRPGVSNTAIKRTFIELAVNILRIASDADIDVDSVLGDMDVYNWVLKQTHTEVLSEWLLDISAQLLERMAIRLKTEKKEVITKACDYITQHLTDPGLSLQTVSKAVGLSSAYFSQLFKVEKGIGLSNYITEKRIIQAQQLLKTTDLKSEEIALLIGFTSATYFGRVFKKSTGVTPIAYKRTACG